MRTLKARRGGSSRGKIFHPDPFNTQRLVIMHNFESPLRANNYFNTAALSRPQRTLF